MYGKTNLGSGTMSARQKRGLAIAGSAIVLGLAGFGVWSAVAPDSYAGSGAGCVNVTVPGSTGGATIHYCGAQARSFCHRELAAPASDPVATRARPACRQAGLGNS
ncbi:MAG TPA: hypothetical protein VGG16_16810 [Streptosporangiaceae bacterium]|jgi:hypothetical protein